MDGFQKVCKTTDIPLGQMNSFEVGHREVLVAHNDDGFFAVVDECSHDSAPISDGELFGGEVVCPRHGARFDIRNGKALTLPAPTSNRTRTRKKPALRIILHLT